METWLREDEEVEFEGFRWFGQNRSQLNKKVVRGSGGVGILYSQVLMGSVLVRRDCKC